MNGHSISHWGIILFPDNGHAQNVLLNVDGSISKLDDDLPFNLLCGIGCGFYNIKAVAKTEPFSLMLPHSPPKRVFEKASPVFDDTWYNSAR